MLTGFVKRIKLSNYSMHSLPDAYFGLMRLTEIPGIKDKHVSTIVWHITQEFKYLDRHATYHLVPVILDLYRVLLGPADQIRIPGEDTAHGLGAVEFLVGEHRGSFFRAATERDLGLLDAYNQGLQHLAERVVNGSFLIDNGSGDTGGTIPEDFEAWQRTVINNVHEVARVLSRIQKYYVQYQHMEAVKIREDYYYPWLLDKLAPFWQKLQWEVGPGNRPSPMMKQLYQHVRDYLVQKKLVIQEEYPEDFDCMTDGHLDTFLAGLLPYIMDHELNYSQTVWIEGRSFWHNAISYMPQGVLNRIIGAYDGTFFGQHLTAERERRESENQSGVVATRI
jgi:hypothetical protein